MRRRVAPVERFGELLLQALARILTIGERAEDVFHVTDDQGRPLGEDARQRLQEKLTEALDRRDAPAHA